MAEDALIQIRLIPLNSFGDFENIGFELHILNNGKRVRKFVRVFVSGSCCELFLKNDKEKIHKAAYLYMKKQLTESFLDNFIYKEKSPKENSDKDFHLTVREYENCKLGINLDITQIQSFSPEKQALV